MYVPAEFRETDLDTVFDFIRENPFGTCIHVSPEKELEICHIPFISFKKNSTFTLEGHLAKQNRMAQLLKNGSEITLVFQGPNAYVSSSLYSHSNVPTWNYQVVHVKAKVRILNEEETLSHLEKSISFFEKKRAQALSFSDLDQNLIQHYLPEITAFSFESYDIEAAFKLSQNRNESDYQAITNDLKKSACPFASKTGENMAKIRTN